MIRKTSLSLGLLLLTFFTVCNEASANQNASLPKVIEINNIAQNPEGIEFNKNDNTFLLSSLNAGPIIKVSPDGNYTAFSSGEKFPLSTAGIHIDYKHNRLLAASFNGLEIMDTDPATKGVSFLRIYNLSTGVLEKQVNLSSLVPDAATYFANDVTVDEQGNAYVSDWYAQVIYKVTLDGKATVFWKNNTGIASGINGLDYHKDGYLLASLLSVNKKGVYIDYALVKIPLNNPKSAKQVSIDDAHFRGFDGMIIDANNEVIGVTNNGKSPGGNLLAKLKSDDNWKSAKVIKVKSMKPSTTVASTPENRNYVIHQDFTDNAKTTWEIEEIKF